MPLVATEIKQKFQDRIHQGLKRAFNSDASKGQSYDPVADANWAKMADAISDIAMDLVTELTTNAMVVPGQQVVGTGGGVPGPMTGATITPGQIM
jgi:hypothetical protein